MDDLIGRLTGASPQRWVPGGEQWVPPLDLSETEDAYMIQIELPGLEPDRISVTLEGSGLLISGEKPHERHSQDERFHRIERRFGAFRRVVTLPGEVDHAGISASARNGVLTVRVPKRQASTPAQVKISISRPEEDADG